MSKRTIRGQTLYNKEWETRFPWLESHPQDQYAARCKWCNHCSIAVASMGITAIKSHEKGNKHGRASEAYKKTVPLINQWIVRPKILPTKDSEPSSSKSADDPSIGNQSLAECKKTQMDLLQGPASQSVPNDHQKKTLEFYLIKKSVAAAEIRWCLQTVISHRSLRNSEKDCILMKAIFPDSKIAENLRLKKDKICYGITYGLGPYFRSELIEKIKNCDLYVVGFDESLNKYAQSQQMDVSVRYWDSQENEVKTRYLTSVFLKSAKANDILEGLKKALVESSMKKILQISMDGPNVNFKVLKLLSAELRPEKDDPQLLDIGSCGIHTLHGAFKTGIMATGWNLIDLFRALYNFFKDVPARRGDYIRITNCNLFPLKFCSIRWLENAPVAQRTSVILQAIKKYSESFANRPKNEHPKCKSFEILQKLVNDELLPAKLAFFEMFAREIEPFLNEFQSDKPLAPFLHTALTEIVHNAMTRIIKKEVLDSTPIKNIDINNSKNLKFTKDVEVGFGARKLLKSKTLSQKDIILFQQDCMKCIQKFISKLFDRSPLKYPLTQAITCINPDIVEIGGEKRLKKALEIFVEKNLLIPSMAESVTREYSRFIRISTVKNEMKNYSRKETRLDHLWMKILGSMDEFQNLKIFVKMILILSHGNAAVERGFSVNKECLVENQKEASLIAQRHVYDAVMERGGILKTEVNQSMVHAFQNSHSRYTEMLKEQRQRKETEIVQEEKKRQISREVRELEKEKVSLDSKRDMIVEEINEKKRKLN
ncbi:unnamed protein product [Brassicogethes aeneus]|uniref:Uncharacterized protein n=1 Tax=Brassicogethes aeneus TaxID=1431903 RepID=A0A9P0AW74_BRAAE|nr:unnamed protein product [Brassicogethes aeneus]